MQVKLAPIKCTLSLENFKALIHKSTLFHSTPLHFISLLYVKKKKQPLQTKKATKIRIKLFSSYKFIVVVVVIFLNNFLKSFFFYFFFNAESSQQKLCRNFYTLWLKRLYEMRVHDMYCGVSAWDLNSLLSLSLMMETNFSI